MSPARAARSCAAPRLLVRAGTWLALLAMLLASGTHWVALQGVAYGSMLVRNAQTAPLGEALARTFDGRHPCPLCHAVQSGRQEEEKQRATLSPESRLELAVYGLPATPARHSARATEVNPRPSARWNPRRDPPPKPPPRG